MGNIYLVGFMGTGKTAVGKKLALALGRDFVDLDDQIEKKEGSEIRDIFANKGEPYFRAIEKKALKDTAKSHNLVVACGGGIVLDKDNIAVMKKTGRIFCLTANIETIIERTSGGSKRPLLNVSDRLEKIKSLLGLRAPFYSLADFSIDTSGLSIEEVAREIICLNEKEKK